MWCQNCGQDVPGIAADGSSEYRCPRCRNTLRQGDSRLRIGGEDSHVQVDARETVSASVETAPASSAGREHRRDRTLDSPPAPHLPPYDGWELEQRLNHIERMLAAEGRAGRDDGNGKSDQTLATVFRFDSAHAQFAKPHDRAGRETRSSRGKLSTAFVWSALLIGVTMSACGGFLMGWSMFSDREDVWSIGLPICLAGGVGLLVALIVQLDRLLNDHRDTAARLDMVDDQLLHLADAAKQLDLLSLKIGRQ